MLQLFQDFKPDDDPLPLPCKQSSPHTCPLQRTPNTAGGISVNCERESMEHGCESNPPLYKGTPPQEIASERKSGEQSQCHSDSSPSTRTIEKLRSFKFVKTSNSKSNSIQPKRPPTYDNQSELTPPPSKRQSIHNDVTLNSDSAINSGNRLDGTSSDEPTFKQPSFNLRASSTHIPTSSQSRGQSLSVGARVIPTEPLHQKGRAPAGTRSNFSATQSNFWHQSNHSDPTSSLPSTPTLSSSVSYSDTRARSGDSSTPRQSSYQLMMISTPQQRFMADPTMQTPPTRVRQTTPLVCTPTGSGMATPIARASVPLKRKFPGPAGLLPSLVSC